MSTFYDDFERANGPLGANWTTCYGSPAIYNGLLTGGAQNRARVTGAGDDQNHIAITYNTKTIFNTPMTSPAVKCNSDMTEFYYLNQTNVYPNWRWDLCKRTGGAQVLLASQTVGTPGNGQYDLELRWDEGVLSFYFNGVYVFEVSDNSLASNVYGGAFLIAGSDACNAFRFNSVVPATLTVAPDPLWVGGGDVTCTATLSGAAWTPGVPGSSTMSVDHGTITDQWTADATTMHFTYTPAEYIGTLTFSESEFALEDTVTATLDPDAAGGFGECLLTEDGAGIVNDTGAIKRPGTLLTTSDVVRLAPTMNIPASLDYLITLTRNLYNPAPDWPDGEPAPDVRLDAIWDWLSGGAELAGLPQTPSTSTPVKVDTERTYAFLKAGTNNFADLSDIVSLLGGSPTVLSHADLKLAIDSIDLSSILARLDDIQPNHLVSLTVLSNLINNLTSGGAYDLQTVLTAISNLNPATAPGLTASTASILGAIGALALEVAGVAAAEGADATASAAAATGVAGLVVTVADIVSDIASILNDLASIKAGLGVTTYHPPVWPGLAHVTMGAPQDLQGGLVVAGPMHGVSVHITSTDPGTGFYDYDVDRCWRNIGALSFLTDRGDHEHWQPLGFSSSFYVPKTMVEAASCKLHLGHGPKGTITPWTING